MSSVLEVMESSTTRMDFFARLGPGRRGPGLRRMDRGVCGRFHQVGDVENRHGPSGSENGCRGDIPDPGKGQGEVFDQDLLLVQDLVHTEARPFSLRLKDQNGDHGRFFTFPRKFKNLGKPSQGERQTPSTERVSRFSTVPISSLLTRTVLSMFAVGMTKVCFGCCHKDPSERWRGSEAGSS